mgnify:CR=1 FL=1
MVVLINKALDVAIARWDRVKAVVDGGPIELITEGRVIRAEIARHEMGRIYAPSMAGQLHCSIKEPLGVAVLMKKSVAVSALPSESYSAVEVVLL